MFRNLFPVEEVMRRLVLMLVSVLGVSPAATANIVLTQWNFNSATADANTGTGSLTPSIGAGSASTVGGVTTTFASGDASGGSSDPSTGDDSGWQTTTYAAQGTGDKTRGVQFNVSTVGMQGISLSYDLRHSNTSSRFEAVQYTLDGSNWIDATTFDGNAGDTWFNGRTVDLSAIAGANNNANFGFRILATFGPAAPTYLASNATATYAPGGTWRFDMVTVNAISAVPEPTSMALLGLAGGVGLVVRMRRRQA